MYRKAYMEANLDPEESTKEFISDREEKMVWYRGE